jgi:hypothetical protein
MNREMLKEAIAEAKTIKETAIANAKAALEEAFTPQLTAMFAERLNEDENEEDEQNESYGMEEEGLEGDFNLEEILAELSETDDADTTDENLMLEEMSDEEIEELVMKVIDDMIETGKLMPGEGEEEDEEDIEDLEDVEDLGGEEDVEIEDEEDVELEELLNELLGEEKEEEVKEGVVETAMVVKDFITGLSQVLANGGDPEIFFKDFTGKDPAVVSAIGAALGFGGLVAKVFGASIVDKLKSLISKKSEETVKETETEPTSTEMEETINELRNELNEVNLLNAKLLYTNKIFKAKNLTESEKVKVLNTFDKAETVKEVKLVFETLTESFKAVAKKAPIKESLGSASRSIASSQTKQPIIEVNDAFARMQKLAGLRK